MGDQEYSDKYEGMDLCTIDDVEDEIGPVLSKQSSTVFPDNRRDQIIGRWCDHEQAKFYQFTGIRYSQLKGHLLFLARDAVLFRVVNRVLKKVQSNRTQRSGGVPSYQDLIEVYSREQEMLEHHIRCYFFPDSKGKDEPYPISFDVDVIVVDSVTHEPIPGVRIYVNNEWCTTTWKDGKIVFPLEVLQNYETYDVQAKVAGYADSATQTISEEGTLTFVLVAE